jgi:myo-inositol-1(or 4)-monophosphatase
LEGGRPLIGVVVDPLRGHTFTAQRGHGAALDGRPICVSSIDRLGDALVSLDWAHADERRAAVLGQLVKLALHCRTVRVLGSAALALAYVGVGWVDAYFAPELKPWDSAAAGLIVSEAGGQVTGWSGESWEVDQPAVLATNGAIHTEILELWERDDRR